MLKVGITGGIGSGKTTVCGIFSSLGIPVFNADAETKQLYTNSKELRYQLVASFGKDVFLNSGAINKAFLSEKLKFDEGRKSLNATVHPYVFERFKQWSEEQNSPYVIKEAAILFESEADKTVNKSILVTAPMDIRIDRVKSRDGRTVEEIQSIMASQWTDSRLSDLVDFVVINDGNRSLIEQVRDLHTKLIYQATHF
ncbi:MAG: dephospho-CoA kinase [Bacteroidota bacterium]|nr:dephospho-CoA kinase [Bacteroidota bacterium]